MILEIGKTYRTRSGQKVKILGRIATRGYYPMVGHIEGDIGPSSFTLDGLYLATEKTGADIVGEWTERNGRIWVYVVDTGRGSLMTFSSFDPIKPNGKLIFAQPVEWVEGQLF